MRKLLMTALVIASVTPAWAADAPPAKDFTLTLSGAEVAEVYAALSARPFAEVEPLMAKIKTEYTAQTAPEPPVHPEPHKQEVKPETPKSVKP